MQWIMKLNESRPFLSQRTKKIEVGGGDGSNRGAPDLMARERQKCPVYVIASCSPPLISLDVRSEDRSLGPVSPFPVLINSLLRETQARVRGSEVLTLYPAILRALRAQLHQQLARIFIYVDGYKSDIKGNSDIREYFVAEASAFSPPPLLHTRHSTILLPCSSYR